MPEISNRLSNGNVPLDTSKLQTADGNFSFDRAQAQARGYLPPTTDSTTSEVQTLRKAAGAENLSDATLPHQPMLRLTSTNTDTANEGAGPQASIGGVGRGGGRVAPYWAVQPVSAIAPVAIRPKSPAEYAAEARALEEQRRQRDRSALLDTGISCKNMDRLNPTDVAMLLDAVRKVDVMSFNERPGSVRHVVAALADAIIEYRGVGHGRLTELYPVAKLNDGLPVPGGQKWTLTFVLERETTTTDQWLPSPFISVLNKPEPSAETKNLLPVLQTLRNSSQWSIAPAHPADSVHGAVNVPEQSALGKFFGW